MDTILVRYGHSVRTKQYTKKSERKICSESRDIDENDIIQWLGEMFGISRRLPTDDADKRLLMTS